MFKEQTSVCSFFAASRRGQFETGGLCNMLGERKPPDRSLAPALRPGSAGRQYESGGVCYMEGEQKPPDRSLASALRIVYFL